MKFEQNLSLLFEDMNIPELFFTEYFCNANGDYVKIYLYSLFLCKHGSEISALDLSKKLSISLKSVEAGFKYWEEQGVLIKKNKTYEFADLKKIAVNKLYTPRLTTSPDEAVKNNEKNILICTEYLCNCLLASPTPHIKNNPILDNIFLPTKHIHL